MERRSAVALHGAGIRLCAIPFGALLVCWSQFHTRSRTAIARRDQGVRVNSPMEQLNPAHVLSTFGLAGVLVIVFIETALLVGFFLPGDSLLFTAGVLAAQSQPFIPLWLLLVTIPLAAIFGDQVGYQIGRAGGSAVFERPSAKRLGPDQLARARAFFERN